jgi:hypothetical protein
MYVKKIQEAPRDCMCAGKPHGNRKITTAEKVVLWYLADCHNESRGCAWPSLATVARYCGGISVRRARQIISSLVCKGVLRRKDRQRENGSTRSNEYFFAEIDSEVDDGDDDGASNIFFSTEPDFRPLRQGQPGVGGKTQLAKRKPSAREAETIRTRVGNTFPPLNYQRNTRDIPEIIQEKRQGETLPPTPLTRSRERGSQSKALEPEQNSRDILWQLVLKEMKSQLATTSLRADLPDEFDLYFRDTWQEHAERGLLVINSRHPEMTKVGIQKYRQRIKQILKKLTGAEFDIQIAAWKG